MERVFNYQVSVAIRNAVISNWRLIAARQFAAGMQTVSPDSLQQRSPTESPLIEQLAELALRPLVEAGVCERHEKINHSWWTLRDKTKAAEFLNHLINS